MRLVVQGRDDRREPEGVQSTPGRPSATGGATRSAGAADGTRTRPENGWVALFWMVFRRSRNPILLLDERRNILELNDPAVALIGGTREELLGTCLASRFPPAERGVAAREWERVLRSGERTGSRVLERPDGTSVEIEWAARAARIGGRRVVITVWVSDQRLPNPAAVGEFERPLTPREQEVVMLIALGEDTREIAAGLHLSPETVKSHIRNAMSKLCVHSRAQLVAVALTSGQVTWVPSMGD